jgi:hypothetical protein
MLKKVGKLGDTMVIAELAGQYEHYGMAKVFLEAIAKYDITETGSVEVRSKGIDTTTEENMMLITDMATAKPDAFPYFISVHVDEGIVAADSIMKMLGPRGFLCTQSISSGENWQGKVEQALRDSRTVLLVETDEYYNSIYCRLEAFYAVASGKRVLRVGCTTTNRPPANSTWLNSQVQYVNLIDPTCQGDLTVMARTRLPNQLTLNAQIEGGRQLVELLARDYLVSLASQLRISDTLPRNATEVVYAADFTEQAFKTEAKAGHFCQCLDFGRFF